MEGVDEYELSARLIRGLYCSAQPAEVADLLDKLFASIGLIF
jgi:hypothetical protein